MGKLSIHQVVEEIEKEMDFLEDHRIEANKNKKKKIEGENKNDNKEL